MVHVEVKIPGDSVFTSAATFRQAFDKARRNLIRPTNAQITTLSDLYNRARGYLTYHSLCASAIEDDCQVTLKRARENRIPAYEILDYDDEPLEKCIPSWTESGGPLDPTLD